MATLGPLYPIDDGTIDTAVITRSTGAGTYASHIDSDPSTGQPDGDYIYNAGAAGGFSFFIMTDVPTDFGSMDTVTVDTFTDVVGRTDDNIDFRCSIWDSTETIMYAGNVIGDNGELVGMNPNGLLTTTLTLTSAGLAASKADWNNARIRMSWYYTQNMAKDAYDLRLHAFEVNGTYTQFVAGAAQNILVGGVSEVETSRAITRSTVVEVYASPVETETVSVESVTAVVGSPAAVVAVSSVVELEAAAIITMGLPAFGAPELDAIAVSGTQIDLSWSVVAGAVSYEIERDSVVIVTGHTTTTYSDTGLEPATGHAYRVRAVR